MRAPRLLIQALERASERCAPRRALLRVGRRRSLLSHPRTPLKSLVQHPQQAHDDGPRPDQGPRGPLQGPARAQGLFIHLGPVDLPLGRQHHPCLRGLHPHVGPDLRPRHRGHRRPLPERRRDDGPHARPQVGGRPLLARLARHPVQALVVEREHRRRLRLGTGPSRSPLLTSPHPLPRSANS